MISLPAKIFAVACGLVCLAGCAGRQNDSDNVPVVPVPAMTYYSIALEPGSTAPLPPPVWPRTYSKDGNSVIMYQPQVDSWKDHARIRFRAAVVVTPIATGRPEYGVVAAQSDTLLDDANRTVLMTNLDVAVRFPGMPDAQATPLKAMVKDLLPSISYLDISLDQILASTHEEPKLPKVPVNLDPPPIFYSDVPAILVIYMGPPQFKPIKDTQLMFAVNTNWVVIMDIKSAQYYLLNDDSWLTSADPVKGPWVPAKEVPAEFSKVPADGNWADVKKQIPGKIAKASPRVITSTVPAELIMTAGPPDYTPIPGTRLMYVSNPAMPLFWDLIDGNYYYLASGRWFRAKELTGPWSAASANLPIEFVKIPADSPMGYVLASIPNTQEARDAILLASIPHKATIKISEAKVDVLYDGAPKWVAIDGTPMNYAANTSYQVISLDLKYYCCYQGVWFVATGPNGPWAVLTSVPAVIYTIPPSCPLYNCTYVQVYSSTPDVVVVGYTAGYSGEYVAATGAIMFGAGMLFGAAMAENSCCSPCYYSYGCAAHYSYSSGCYYREGSACYGPHGGAGWGAAYNPSTGTYARAGAAYGPNGSVHGSQAYNPWTNTYAQHTGGSNGYKSWGSSYVQQGDKWAEGSHQSGAYGSVGQVQNSSGQWAEGARTANSGVAKTSNGDLYASHDGNVYKQSDSGQWQKYSGNGNWSDTSYNKPAPASGSESSYASGLQSRAQSSSAQNSWRNDYSSDNNWKSSFEGRDSGGGDSWSDHDTRSSLNSDAWSRDRGSSSAMSSWDSRGGGDRSSGFGGGGWGGRSGGFGGGRGRR